MDPEIYNKFLSVFGSRVTWILFRKKIGSLEELASKTELEILGWRNIGEGSLQKVKAVLLENGLKLGTEFLPAPSQPKHLRDFFAAMAMQGELAAQQADFEWLADRSYKIADAMLKRRKQ